MKKAIFLSVLSTGVLSAALAGAQSTPTPATAPTPTAAPAPPPPGPGMGGPRHAPGMHHGPGAPDGPGGLDARLLPPGTWWRSSFIVNRIGLSTDQQKHIDQIFLDSRVQLIHMHASLEEEQLKLDSALQATPFNQGEAMSQIDKIADTRADLEKANAKMLLTIRGVLSADQWTKLQASTPGPNSPPPPMAGDGKHSDRRGPGGHGGPQPGGPGGPGGPDSDGGPGAL